METTDLVERLLLRAREFERATDFGGKMMDDARNRLEAAQSALQARVEKLEGENERLRIALTYAAETTTDKHTSRKAFAALAEDYCGIVEVNEEDFRAEGERE